MFTPHDDAEFVDGHVCEQFYAGIHLRRLDAAFLLFPVDHFATKRISRDKAERVYIACIRFVSVRHNDGDFLGLSVCFVYLSACLDRILFIFILLMCQSSWCALSFSVNV
jgi:hypothetical protein